MSRRKPSKEILKQVADEIGEHLSSIEAILLRLGEAPGSVEDTSELFRYMHTIKGVAGVLETPVLVEVSHQAENLLVRARDAGRTLAEDDLDLLLQAKDLLQRCLHGETVDASTLLEKLSGSKPSAVIASAPVPEVPAAAEEAGEEESEPVFLVFRVRGRLCAFPVERIREVSQVLPWRSVPFTGESFCGMTSLRGQLVPVLDPAPLLGLSGPKPKLGRILFLETGDESTGVLVDRVLGVHSLPGWRGSMAALRHFGVDLVEAVAEFREEGTVAVLATERLLEIASGSV